ncbi:hypothetical protein BDQ17DRAFT_1357290 [Cyathus striatus]|nr:hypothetical protein BDQ17DRAFT_1357290 [Cyathus striatus]
MPKSKNPILPLTGTLALPPSPTSSYKGHKLPCPGLPKRYTRLFLAILISLVILFTLHPRRSRATIKGYPPFPLTLENSPDDFPTYEYNGQEYVKPALFERYTEWEESVSEMVYREDALANLERGEGGGVREQKYLYLANHQRYAGWGNAMQEMLLNVHLSWESGRGFVYDNYTWDINGPPYSDWNGKLRPSRIPLSTMVGGPIVGYPFSPSSPPSSSSQTNSTTSATTTTIDTSRLPRSISKTQFHTLCAGEIEYIDADVVRKTLPGEVTAAETVRAWVDQLKILGGSAQLFDIWIMGSSRVHDIYSTLAVSPVLTQFKWSPLIHRMFLKNIAYFVELGWALPRGESRFPFDFNQPLSITSEQAYTKEFLEKESETLPRPSRERGSEAKRREGAVNEYGLTPDSTPLPIMALHLRRGDFEGHCNHLSTWSSTYTGFNTLPSLPDNFNTTQYPKESEEYKVGYQRHCWPSVEDVVRVVRGGVVDWVKKREEERMGVPLWKRVLGLGGKKREMRRVYVMTNADVGWLEDVRAALVADALLSQSPSSPSYKEWKGVKWSWDGIFSSRDLDVGWEEKHVSQALDMYLGERAEVFVGNGFSSLTANVVVLRVARGVGGDTRFW